MIYCIDPSLYPTPEQALEEIIYQDENEFEWRIARVKNGFMVRFFGDDYFKDNFFVCEVTDDLLIKVKNTNCIFFQDADFDTFCEMRNILKNGFTDDIWETIQELFTTRFESSQVLLESEVL